MAFSWAESAFARALKLLGRSPAGDEAKALRELCIGLRHMARALDRMERRIQ